MTPMEGRGLLRGGILLFALAAIRLGVQHSRPMNAGLETGADDVHRLLEDARAIRDEEARRSAPLAPGETIDPNQAAEEDLDRLPGVGPSVARAILDEREGRGGFAVAEDLLRVRGIGPARLEEIRPYLDFSGGIPLDQRRKPTVRQIGGDVNGVDRSASVSGSVSAVSPPTPRIDVNRAGPQDLESLPGIGPALAKRIVESRNRDGPFRVPDDLLRVRGIGPRTLDRIRVLIVPRG